MQTLFAVDAKLPHAGVGCGAGVGAEAGVGDAEVVVKVLVDAKVVVCDAVAVVMTGAPLNVVPVVVMVPG